MHTYVLKCRVYYLGFAPSFQDEGAYHAMKDHMGKHQDQSGDRKSNRNAWTRSFIGVPMVKAMGNQSEQHRIVSF